MEQRQTSTRASCDYFEVQYCGWAGWLHDAGWWWLSPFLLLVIESSLQAKAAYREVLWMINKNTGSKNNIIELQGGTIDTCSMELPPSVLSDPTWQALRDHCLTTQEKWRLSLEAAGGSEDSILHDVPYLIAQAASAESFIRFRDAIEATGLPKAYHLFENGRVYIYEFPCQQHEAPPRYITTLLVRYMDGFGDGVFDLLGSTAYTIGPHAMIKEADESLRHSSLMDQLPVAVVEIGWSETLWELHCDAQRWVGPLSPGPYPKVCLIVKIFNARERYFCIDR